MKKTSMTIPAMLVFFHTLCYNISMVLYFPALFRSFENKGIRYFLKNDSWDHSLCQEKIWVTDASVFPYRGCQIQNYENE